MNGRHKEWREVVNECKQYEFADWPLEGPMSVGHLIRHFHNFGGDSKRWLLEWMRSKNISENDRVAHEMRCLADFMFTAGSYDQINLVSLAGCEVIATGDYRRLLLGRSIRTQDRTGKTPRSLQASEVRMTPCLPVSGAEPLGVPRKSLTWQHLGLRFGITGEGCKSLTRQPELWQTQCCLLTGQRPKPRPRAVERA